MEANYILEYSNFPTQKVLSKIELRMRSQMRLHEENYSNRDTKNVV